MRSAATFIRRNFTAITITLPQAPRNLASERLLTKTPEPKRMVRWLLNAVPQAAHKRPSQVRPEKVRPRCSIQGGGLVCCCLKVETKGWWVTKRSFSWLCSPVCLASYCPRASSQSHRWKTENRDYHVFFRRLIGIGH